MKRVWMNHWFSTAYNIVNLIKSGDPSYCVIGSNENFNSPIRNVCDEWFLEPVLSDDLYVDYCLNFCVEHNIDAFIPRRGMLAISKNKSRFEELGIKVMVDSYPMISVLNKKNDTYELLKREKIGLIPDYRVVTTAEQFNQAYLELSSSFSTICFKFIRDEGGKSFRLIDNTRSGYSALFKKQTTRITFSAAMEALAERENFSPVMVMPYLPGDEISVDCLNTRQGIIMVPRVKGATRIEKIQYNEVILSTCNAILDRFPLEQPCNIQFKYLDGEPYFLEINTRMSGGIQMACLGSGINIPKIAVDKMFGVETKWKNLFEEKCVTYIETPVVL